MHGHAWHHQEREAMGCLSETVDHGPMQYAAFVAASKIDNYCSPKSAELELTFLALLLE